MWPTVHLVRDHNQQRQLEWPREPLRVTNYGPLIAPPSGGANIIGYFGEIVPLYCGQIDTLHLLIISCDFWNLDIEGFLIGVIEVLLMCIVIITCIKGVSSIIVHIAYISRKDKER